MFCRGCVFAPLSHKILNMTRPKLSPRDIWRTLILACRRTLSPMAVWKIPMPKITLFFTVIPIVVTAIFIGVLDFRIVLVLQFGYNTYRLSLWKRVPVNSRHSDGPMKIFLTCAAAYSRCRTARSRNQQNYIRIFAAQPVEKKCQDTTASETDARLQAVTVWQCDYDNLGYALNR